MFRLVKILNGNTQAEVRHIDATNSILFAKGEALITNNGTPTTPTALSLPEYIYLTRNYLTRSNKINVLLVTENSVFKVEYTGTIKPYIGMPVGLSTYKTRMDAVTYNSNGKGTIVGIDDTEKYVFVRFRK